MNRSIRRDTGRDARGDSEVMVARSSSPVGRRRLVVVVEEPEGDGAAPAVDPGNRSARRWI